LAEMMVLGITVVVVIEAASMRGVKSIPKNAIDDWIPLLKRLIVSVLAMIAALRSGFTIAKSWVTGRVIVVACTAAIMSTRSAMTFILL